MLINKKDFKHGASSYSYHKCRCDICTKAAVDAVSKYRKTSTGIEKTKGYNKLYYSKKSTKLIHSKHRAKYRNTVGGNIKIKARHKLEYALSRGLINKSNCSVCGVGYIGKIQAHHVDYNNPLDVIWVCEKHHKEIHRKVNKKTS